MQNIIRGTISQTPDHGAEVVRVILEDKELRAEWEAELTEMRERMKRAARQAGRRHPPASPTPRISTSSPSIPACSRCSACREDVVRSSKLEDGVYMINDSRINVAGIPEDRVGRAGRQAARRHAGWKLNPGFGRPSRLAAAFTA